MPVNLEMFWNSNRHCMKVQISTSGINRRMVNGKKEHGLHLYGHVVMDILKL
jgi:hypothetical protein